MMKINVYSEKSGSFASDSKMKPMIIIESKRKSLESLKEKYPDAMIIVSVEGIWQGLKVFEDADVDTSFFSKRDMKNLKRTVLFVGRGFCWLLPTKAVFIISSFKDLR